MVILCSQRSQDVFALYHDTNMIPILHFYNEITDKSDTEKATIKSSVDSPIDRRKRIDVII